MNKEAKDLWERAHQALQTALLLVEKDPDGAASRAYYAAFYATSAHFALINKNFSKHTALEAAVHRDLVKAKTWTKDLGQEFSLLRELRATGDYGGDLHVSHSEAKDALASAGRIMAQVQKDNPSLNAILQHKSE